ncbi:MAG: hypothetical protein IPM77_11650 [Crocinitomicaceae bacterium]|nr:hypothetical protein [Crocinitomicaceae bacterium]
MKLHFTVCLFCSVQAMAQISYEKASELSRNYEVYAYSYFEGFAGKQGYASSVILTLDGGCAFLDEWYEENDHGPLLIKLDKDGKEQWKTKLKGGYEESESQGIVEDAGGNFYVFALVYTSTGYLGGCERVMCVSPSGELNWDKLIGAFTLENSPTFSYIHSDKNGKVELRGHIAKEKPAEGKDPDYYYWSAWLDSKGDIVEETGKRIDWANDNWQQWYIAE